MEVFHMNKREIAILSFRVLSFYALIEAIGKLSNVIYYILQGISEETFVMNVLLQSIPLILLTLCGILLWYIAPLLATSIFKSTIQEKETKISSVDIQIIAFSVVGLCLLATALPNVAEFVLVFYSFLVTPISESNTILFHSIILFVLKIILGLWLLFDSRRIVNYIYRKREK
jgi:hypothetical protein